MVKHMYTRSPLFILILAAACLLASTQAAVLEIFTEDQENEGQTQILGADWTEFGQKSEANDIDGMAKESKEDPFQFLFKNYSNLLDDQPIDKKIEEARQSYAEGDVERALTSIEQVLKIQPDHTALLTLRAGMLVDLGRLDDAMETAREATSLAPDNLIPKLIEAACLVKIGSLDEAEIAYKFVLSKRPLHVGSLDALARIALRRNDLATSIKYYKMITDQNPEDLFTLYKLGVAYREIGNLPEAIATFELAVKTEPNFASAHNELGVALAATKQNGPALEAFGKAISLNPNMHKAFANIGALLATDGQQKKAIGYWLRSLDLQIEDAQVWKNLLNALDTPLPGGSSLSASGTNALARAIAEDPFKAADGFYRKAISCLAKDQLDEANHYFVQALTIDMQNPEYFNGYGAALAMRGYDHIAKPFFMAALHIYPEYESARENLNAVRDRLNSNISREMRIMLEELPIHASNPEMQFQTASKLASEVSIQKALPLFQRAHELDPENVVYQIGLSKAYSQLSEWQPAINTFMLVYRAEKDNPDYQYRLSWLLLQQPDIQPEQAQISLRLIQKALQQAPTHVMYLKTQVDAYLATHQTDRAMESATTALRIARDTKNEALAAQLKWRIRSILDAE
ncbi:MAG: tetratricopeptide (TPR) repeat protein [Candidatus Omnitrophota bacterium]|jgi:tetratricopeptide (TPR) repeat protein